jgi:hypothetical protein
MFMEDAYRAMACLQGEPFAVTLDDHAAALTGIYDRRILYGDIAGSSVHDSDFRIGVVASDLPPWVAPGARVDIRGDTLSVTALEPDGQGLVYLVCRPAT